MDTGWIQLLSDDENFLAIYDVLLDIKKDMEISRPDKVSILLLPTLIRFPSLLPGDSVNNRNRYCRLRQKATEFLEMHKVIKNFRLQKHYST